jgi:hypothetical protein
MQRFTVFAGCTERWLRARLTGVPASYQDLVEAYLQSRTALLKNVDAALVTKDEVWTRLSALGDELVHAINTRQQQRGEQQQRQDQIRTILGLFALGQQSQSSDLAGAAAILQGFAGGFLRNAPPPPVKCETRQTFGGRFPQWQTTCQ